MQNVNFTEVKLSDLSEITHQILLSEHERFKTPEFKIIRYFGVYKIGSAGKNDFTYIRSTFESAQAAWYSSATIIDVSQLNYQWGDEMDSAIGLGSRHIPYGAQDPLAILVGDKCREALKTLWPGEYQDYCCDTMKEAIDLARTKIVQYDRLLKQWREEHLKKK